MIRLLIALLSIIMSFNGCIGPFRKQPEPETIFMPVKTESPTISINWGKIENNHSDKEEVKAMLGIPDFVDKHKAGEDWYYSHTRSVGYAVVSFPTSGHLINHVQYVKYPEWK